MNRRLMWWLCALALGLGTVPTYAQTMQFPKPTPGLMPNPAEGKKLFAERCAQCHGVDLRGSVTGPPLLHRIYEPSHHGDIAFQLAVRNGSRQHHWNFGDMQPVPGLTPDDVAHITAYVRGEQRKAGIK
ncbi:MAG: cytochrome c [Burkholderiales bacterium]